MRLKLPVAFCFAVPVWVCATVGYGAPKLPTPDTSAELKLLQGRWRASDCVWEGLPRKGRRFVKDGLQLRVTGRAWELSGGKAIEFESGTRRYSVVIDRTGTPCHMDLHCVDESGKPIELMILEAPNGGGSWVFRKRTELPSKGICECDGTMLRGSFGRPGDPRPVTLDKSKLEEGQTLISFDRVAE